MKLTMTVLAMLCLAMAFWWPVETRRGVNYQVVTSQIPLGMKVLEFLDRSYQYRRTAQEIVREARTEEERARAVWEWMRANLHAGIPNGLPVVDDHVWHILIRGYGAVDQWADVFAVLGAYAGLETAVLHGRPDGADAKLVLPAVKLDGRWCPLDPYHGYWFVDEYGRIASIDDIRRIPAIARHASGGAEIGGVPYETFCAALAPPEPESQGALRASRQRPLRRLWIELRERLKMSSVSEEQAGRIG